jgi:hypothetical protein
MTTRDILQSDIAELVPAAENAARQLPIRDTVPRNTAPLDVAAAEALGIKFLPDDPAQVERFIDRARK